MFDLCLFDLDDTLIITSDLEDIRHQGRNDDTDEYREELVERLEGNKDRVRYTQCLLDSIRTENPQIKIGIFTRAPRAYVETVLEWAYPGYNWDVIIAFEDVEHTKPNGEGIDIAMRICEVEYIDCVALVGDSEFDIRAAYHAGVVSILDRGSWPDRLQSAQWNALSWVPDAIIRRPREILQALSNLASYLPALEAGLESEGGYFSERFDRFNYFIPSSLGGDRTSFPVFYLGRHFAGYDCLKYRAQWHVLTESIHDHKDSEDFPGEWIVSIINFIRHHYSFFGFGSLIVTCVPARPGRPHRLQCLLSQLQLEVEGAGFFRDIQFRPHLLAYAEGVQSNSREHLSREERFRNIRDHLFVNQPDAIPSSAEILVIDDVVTSGATFVYSKLYLERHAGCRVTCLALAKNISRVI
ncbi:TPA: HAD hydrolase-like protein [Pseudomonas aeruginosa]